MNKLKQLDYRYYIGIVLIAIAIVGGAIFILRAPKSAEAEWFNDSWYYRQTISITNSSTAQTNFQFQILDNEDLSSLVSAGKLQSSLADLRFTDLKGNLLDYWTEDNTNASVNVWIKVPSIPTTGATIYMYYGNSSVDDASDATKIIGNSGNPGSSCTDIKNNRDAITGLYYIIVTSSEFQVYCDMSTEGGGWTQIINLDTNDGTDHWWGDTAYWQGTSTEGSAATSLTSGYKSQAFTDMDNFAEMMFFMHTEGVEVAYGVYDLLGGYQSSSFHDLLNITDSDAGTTITGIQQHQSGASGAPLNTLRPQPRYGDEFVDSFNTEAVVVNRIKRFNTDGLNYMRLATTLDNTSYAHTFSGLGVHHERPVGSYTTKLEAAPITAYCGDIPRYGSDATATTGFCGSGFSYDRDMAVFVRDSTPVVVSLSTASPATEEKGPGPVGYWSFDEGYGTIAQDRTSNNNDGTITGATWQTEDQCISGKCLYFDGTDDSITITNSQSIVPTEVTVSLWIKTNSDSILKDILKKYSTTDYWFIIDTNNKVLFYTGGVSSSNAAFSTTSIQTNKWYFITGIYDGVNTKIYINGNYEGSASSPLAPTQGSANLNIGQGLTAGRYFNGFIDEVKIYPYARTEAQVLTDYNAGLAGISSASGISVAMGGQSQKSLSDGLVGYWKMDEASWSGVADEVIDASGNGNDGIAVSGATTAGGKFGNGGSFDGTNDYIAINDVAPEIAGSSVTFSAWINGPAQHHKGIIPVNTSSGGNRALFLVYNNLLGLYDGVWDTGSTIIADNTWHHVAYTYNNNGLTVLYVDGNVDATLTKSISFSSTDLVSIGQEWDSSSPSDFFNGSIDEVRIYNRALSSREIKQLYEYAPGPVAYYDFEEKSGTTLYDKSGNDFNSTAFVSDPSWELGKYGSALAFDGNDSVTLGSNNMNGARAGTWNFWVKWDSDPSSIFENVYIQEGSTWIAHYNGKLGIDLSDGSWYDDGGGHSTGTVFPAGSFTDLDWHYASFVWDGTYMSGYLDGIKAFGPIATTGVSQLQNGSIPRAIGSRGSNYYLNGKVDDFKVYNYARTQKQILEDINGGRSASKSPLAYWKFDEGYGTIVHDISGNDEHIDTWMGLPAWTNNGKFGKAVSLAVDNSYMRDLTFDYDILRQGHEDKAWTFSIWAQPGAQPDHNEKIILGRSGWHGGILAYQNDFRFQIRDLDGIADVSIIESISNWNQWYHLVGTYDNHTAKFYINGSLIGIDIMNSSFKDFSDDLYIGYPTPYDFNGLVDEAKVFNYALTEDEVHQEYNQGKAIVMGSEKNTSSSWNDGGFGGDAPVAYWNFEEGSGTTANDISGNANTGTLTSMDDTDWVLGKESSWALDFDGSNDYVTIVDDASQRITALTVEAWVKSTKNNASLQQGIVAKANLNGAELGWILRKNPDNKFYFSTTPSYPRSDISTYSNIAYTDNNWHHVVGQRLVDGTNYIYIDGIRQVASRIGSTIDVDTNPQPITIATVYGDLPTHATYHERFDGQIDEVKIYNYARTPAQIAWDYNGGKPIGHWRLDDGEGTMANDASGNDNDGTLTSMDPATDWLDASDCKFEGCLDFDGSNDYVDAGDMADLGDTFSVSVWAKADTFSSYNPLVFRDGNITNNFGLRFDGTGNVEFRQYAGYEIRDSQGNNTGEWIYIVAISDNLAGSVYVNGILRATSTFPASFVDTGNIHLGLYNYSTGYYFDGSIDDIQIYNYALAPSQIKEIYNGGLIRFK